MKKNIENTVAQMTVAQMRKEASVQGIKNAKQYKRVELEKLLVEALSTKLPKTEVKKSVAKKTGKRAKAEKVDDAAIEMLAKELLADVEDLDGEILTNINRKVLIEVMKMLHCSKWYRTYDKATMIKKILDAVA